MDAPKVIRQVDRAFPNNCFELQRRISERYCVSPIDSDCAFEEVQKENGIIERIAHHTFAYRIPKDFVLDVGISEAMELIWEGIKNTFKEGTFIVWRKRPVIEPREIRCECCGEVSRSHVLIVRLGGLEVISDTHTVKEGCSIPVVPR